MKAKEMKISILVAMDEAGLIGKGSALPWHLPADLKYFKATTWAMPVLMGRKTFESIGKPLPGRTNIVLTRNKAWAFEKVITVTDINEGIAHAEGTGAKELFVIGGAEIYSAVLPITHNIYRTLVHHRFEGDVYFPAYNEKLFQLASVQHHKKDEKNAWDYSFEVWEKI